jgi:hypothetical protein
MWIAQMGANDFLGCITTAERGLRRRPPWGRLRRIVVRRTTTLPKQVTEAASSADYRDNP